MFHARRPAGQALAKPLEVLPGQLPKREYLDLDDNRAVRGNPIGMRVQVRIGRGVETFAVNQRQFSPAGCYFEHFYQVQQTAGTA